MLPPRDLALRLVEQGLLDRAALFRGAIALEDATHRNHDTIVLRRGVPSLFVKQPFEDDAIGDEARRYAALSSDRRFRRLVPPMRHHAPGLLVLSAVRGTTLAARATRRRRVGAGLARELAAGVALLHDADLPFDAPMHVPWVLSLASPPIELYARASAANLEMLRIVQSSAAICRELAAIERAWRWETSIHNDLRLENVIVRRAGRRARLAIVDWELAARGDAAWDTGSVIAALLALWIASLPYVNGMTMAAVERGAGVPLRRIRPALKAFWSTYAARRRFGRRAAREHLVRAVTFAGARLLQLAWERVNRAARIRSETIFSIQTAANVLEDPERARATLFGSGGRHA